MTQKIQIRVEQIASWWCRHRHNSLLWPISGEYTCAICGRHYPVPWRMIEPRTSGADDFLRFAGTPPFRPDGATITEGRCL
jgi:hypothetical protein